MGIRIDIQTKLAAAFVNQLSDTVKTFNYTDIDDDPTYDPSTGLTSSHSSFTGITGAFVDYTADEIAKVNQGVLDVDERIRPTDVKLIVLQTILTSEPKRGDIVAVTGGKTYVVISWRQDPASAVWEVQLRTMKES